MWSPDRPHAWRGQIFLMPEGATITLHVSMLIFFEPATFAAALAAWKSVHFPSGNPCIFLWKSLHSGLPY